MKILVLFIDMVRVGELNLFNSTKEETHLDHNLKDLGGTLFTRCYTPGPDTPRSNACMQTGLYPYFNGCDTRIKWPKYFIKEEISTIFDHAYNKGFTINACIRKHTVETGLLKYSETTKINYFGNYTDFIKKSKIDENVFSFVYDPDWHTAITDYHSTLNAFREGDRVVSKLFKKYLTKDYCEQYDYVIVYSDHGFQLQSENNYIKSKLELLDDSRNQILMFIHKQGDVDIKRDNRLSSMLDLYATIENLIDCSDYRQGYSLLEEPKRRILHIEDHQDFKVYPEIMIKQWRVISDEFDVRTDAKSYTCNRDSEVFKKVDSYLRRYSPKYIEYTKQLDVWRHYAELSNDNSLYYVIGEKRGGKYELLMNKLWQKLKEIVIKKFSKCRTQFFSI